MNSNVVFRFRNRLLECKSILYNNMGSVIFAVWLTFINIPMQGQVRFGLKGGMNMSKFDMSSGQGVEIDFSNRYSFHVGGFAEIPVGGFFSVQPEFLFSAKGTHCKLSSTFNFPPSTGYDMLSETSDLTYSPCYIELPIYLRAGLKAGPGKVIAGVGPYFAYGIGGKLKADLRLYSVYPDSETTIAIGKGKEEKDIFKSSDKRILTPYLYPNAEMIPLRLKRFDVGFAGFAGYELKFGLFLTAGFQKGLYNIDYHDGEGDKLKNKTFSLSAGYKF